MTVTPSSVTEQNVERYTTSLYTEYQYRVEVGRTNYRYETRDSGTQILLGYDPIYETRTGRTYHDLYSTDIGYAVLAIGEGPLYRIMPEGPQSIELNDSTIDSLINLNGDGNINTDEFVVDYRTGTDNQSPMPVFGDSVTIPKFFPSRVSLKKGTHSPASSIEQQATTSQAWDQLRFNFIVTQLFSADDKGKTHSHSIKLKIDIYKSNGTTLIKTVEETITGKITTELKISRIVTIPVNDRDERGYIFNISKESDESNDSKIRDEIFIIGWDEIEKISLSYPSTALVGYAIKSTDQFSGGIPRFTTTIKGLIIDVPSNYNQPVIPRVEGTTTTYEIDWRELESNTIARTATSSSVGGIRLENDHVEITGSGTLIEDNIWGKNPGSDKDNARTPQIYLGIWDGKFKKAWSQNPIWIIYYLLTNERHGLGIPAHNIDKYNFYKAAQYCDNCDPHYGRFKTTIQSRADGSYRHKLRGTNTETREALVGDNIETLVDQRRFICDLSIEGGESTIDILNQITAAIRGVLTYSNGKIVISMDMENEQPVMYFNETNIKEGSLNISGNKESDTITGIEASYVDPNNSFKGDVVKVDSAEIKDGRNITGYDNITSVNLKGVTRRSQATRFCQYQIAASRYQRRNIKFTTGPEAINLSIGDPIAVSVRETGVSYGYGGRLGEHSNISFTCVLLEHFTEPPLTSEVITSNTLPLLLKLSNTRTDTTTLFTIDNSRDYNDYFDISKSIGLVVCVDNHINEQTREIYTNGLLYGNSDLYSFLQTFTKNDIWTLGEFNPNNGKYSRHEDYSEKLFKVIGLEKNTEDFTIDVSAEEYISNVYTDSEKFIEYDPPNYKSYQPSLKAPSVTKLTLTPTIKEKVDGTIGVDVQIDTNSNEENVTTELFAARLINNIELIDSISNSGRLITADFNSNKNFVSGNNCVILGKNGFKSQAGIIKLYCTDKTTVSKAGYSINPIQLTISDLDKCIDLNTRDNVIDTCSYIILPSKDKDGVLNLALNKYPDVVETSYPIIEKNSTNGTIVIENKVIGNNQKLFDLLPDKDFYITIQQSLEKSNVTANNSLFVQGSYSKEILNGHSSQGRTIDLEYPVRSKEHISLQIKGESSSAFNLIDGNTKLTFTHAEDNFDYYMEIDKHDVPIFEISDVITIDSGETFTIQDTTYTGANANSTLTDSHIYAVTLNKTPVANLYSQYITNISRNPVGPMTVTGSTVTVDSTYSGQFSLSNVYTLAENYNFEPFPGDNNTRILEDADEGAAVILARNKNEATKRLSPYVSEFVKIVGVPIGRATNLSIREKIYREAGTTLVEAILSFTPSLDQKIKEYEIEYKLEGTGLSVEGQWVKLAIVPTTDEDVIEVSAKNISRVDRITFRVTALNNKLRGESVEVSKIIIGKKTLPQNVYDFSVGQIGRSVNLSWRLRRVKNQLEDLDLSEIKIRRIAGNVPITLDNYNKADQYVTVSNAEEEKTIPIDSYGTYTYLVRTIDTSGNESEHIVGYVFTSFDANLDQVLHAYSEDNPSVSFIPTVTNTNNEESKFPSFQNSDTGGLYHLEEDGGTPSTVVDNANGSSSGWSSPSDFSEINSTGTNIEYITQVRQIAEDSEDLVFASIHDIIVGEKAINETYQDQWNLLHAGVSDDQATFDNTVLVDSSLVGAKGIGLILNEANARYDSTNKTLMSGGADGIVYAVRDPGQTSTPNNDTPNLHSYALIAGVIDDDSVKLGDTYYANGVSTGSNSLANLVMESSRYQLVDLRQYNDLLDKNYQGSEDAITVTKHIRTSETNPYYTANGNVNPAIFTSFRPIKGARSFRYFQIKISITNNNPESYDYTLNQFRYYVSDASNGD